MKNIRGVQGTDLNVAANTKPEAANALFRDIYNTVKIYDSTKLVNLPAGYDFRERLGGGELCVYADLMPTVIRFHHATYGVAGSARPGIAS